MKKRHGAGIRIGVRKIYDWVKSHTDSDLADIILFLPDLFVLSMGLILDARVPSKLKVALVSAVAYVLSPFDLIPEALLGVAGLIDDAGILIIALHTVFGALELTPDEVEQIFRDYWHGHGHPVEIVVKLYNLISKGANQLFAKLRKWQKHSQAVQFNSGRRNGRHRRGGHHLVRLLAAETE